MATQQNAYPLRLEPNLSKKIKELAKVNDRSFKGQIENILKNYIAQYEKENGEIKITSDESIQSLCQ